MICKTTQNDRDQIIKFCDAFHMILLGRVQIHSFPNSPTDDALTLLHDP